MNSRFFPARALSVLFFIGALSARAYEVDNYTNRAALKRLQDSSEALNSETNRRMLAAIIDVNKNGKCDPGKNPKSHPALYGALLDALDGDPVAEVEDWADSNLKGANRNGKIYQGSGITDGVVRWAAGYEPTIRIGSHILGVDKLGHFMSQGYEYFEKAALNDQTVGQVLSYGESLEEGKYGLRSTGIKSYGDMSANFAGLAFWQNVLGGPNPIVKCQNEKYVVNRPFSWNDYVTDAWDEAVNCSAFNSGTAKAVKENLKAGGEKCPIEPDRCRALANLNCATKLLAAQCLTLIPAAKINRKCSLPLVASDRKPAENVPSTSVKLKTIPANECETEVQPGVAMVKYEEKRFQTFAPILVDAMKIFVAEPDATRFEPPIHVEGNLSGGAH